MVLIQPHVMDLYIHFTQWNMIDFLYDLSIASIFTEPVSELRFDLQVT